MVADSLEKFSRDQKAALLECLQRYGTDRQRTNDVGSLGDGLFELRQSLDGVALRIYFGSARDDDGPICLAVHALNKKSRKTPTHVLQTARSRLEEWKRRYPPALTSKPETPNPKKNKKHGK